MWLACCNTELGYPAYPLFLAAHRALCLANRRESRCDSTHFLGRQNPAGPTRKFALACDFRELLDSPAGVERQQ